MNLCTNILIIISLLGWSCDQLAAFSSKGIIGDTVCDDSTTEICKTLDLNAFCDLTGTKGTCACERGMVEISDKCEVIIGGYCNSTRPCVESQNAPPTSVCFSTQCNCVPNYVHSVDNTKCLNIIDDLNDSECLESQQCQKGKAGSFSECTFRGNTETKVCKCTVDAVEIPVTLTDATCQPKATSVGMGCISDSQCTPNLKHSHCIERKCQCTTNNATSSSDNSRCLLKVYLEETCTDPDPAQCTHVANANCTRGPISTCQCNSGYIHDKDDKSTCFLKATVVGGRCNQSDIQCDGISKASCNPISKTCDCDKGYVPNGIKTQCVLEQPFLNKNCDETAQCTVKNSECRKDNDADVYKTCQCIKNKYVQPTNGADECLEIRYEANMECKDAAQCIAGLNKLSDCIDGVCQCRLNYGYYNHSCYIPAGLGEICNTTAECYVGVNEWAYCATELGGLRRCQCMPGAKPFDSVCYMKKIIGDSCKSDNECSYSIPGEVICNSYTYRCDCKMDYLPGEDLSYCFYYGSALSIHIKPIFEILTLAVLIFSLQLRGCINL